jgi:hypothetical protein
MSTRASIRIIERSYKTMKDYDLKRNAIKHVINLYHHCDGYPSGVGTDLQEYLHREWDDKPQWMGELIATDLVRGAIKNDEDKPDWGYRVALCPHGDIEYGYEIDCDERTLTAYTFSYGSDRNQWTRTVAIPERENKTSND